MDDTSNPYSFSTWCRETLVEFTQLNAEKQVFGGFLIAVLLTACIQLIEFTGGLPSVFEHLIYFPLIFAGLLLGPRIGALGGFVTGLMLTPLFFPTELIDQESTLIDWPVRLLMLTLLPLITGLISRSVQQLHHLESKAKKTFQGTALPNHEALLDQINEWSKQNSAPTDALMDIINLRLSNIDKLRNQVGQQKADRIVAELAKQLKEALGQSAEVGQTATNELVGLHANTEHSREELQEKLQQLLSQPIVIDGSEFRLDTTAGVLRVKRENAKDKANMVIHDAQQHSYKAAENNQTFSFLDHDNDLVENHDEPLSKQLLSAIDSESIKLYYQPRLNTNSGYFSVIEAIVRWKDNQRGYLSPEDFKPLIEEASLAKQFTGWMIKTAFNDVTEWMRNDFIVRLSLHITLNDILEPAILNLVAKSLNKTKFPPSSLSLEVSERSLVRISEQSKIYLKKLRSMGVTIIADQFGEGQLTLQSIFVLPVDAIKLSENLVLKATSNSDKKRTLISMIKMARSRGLKTIATGVDNRAKLLLLKHIGCDELQGSILSKPTAKDDIPWARIR
ncbi:EAL domain-containing protein [Idiomarina sp.]|uniref:EAL domain-containing protein n=1 Tax=Idiomarina sp. TaxID=1874361 RepID=UPI0025BFB80C|nr:GGDEF domain-containing phosphodiesterase [Idiomarina sp.]NQZ05393.1 GGDEF domain-containing protein [Idiomarina sp.]